VKEGRKEEREREIGHVGSKRVEAKKVVLNKKIKTVWMD